MTNEHLKVIKKMRADGATFSKIAERVPYGVTTIWRYCAGERKETDARRNANKFLCSESTCGDCHYFRKMKHSDELRNYCAYTLITGKARDITKTCAECAEKRTIRKGGKK